MYPSERDLLCWLDIATEAALAAGAELMRCYGRLENIREKGRPGDLLTEADQAAEAAVLDILGRHLPDHAILAEESGRAGAESARFRWAIDPLDGTTNFAHSYPLFATSIGLLVDGVPTLGVVYNPKLDELFRAGKGLGATLNRQQIRVSDTHELGRSLLVTGFAYDRRDVVDNNYAEFCRFTHLTQGVRRGGSASVDLAYVACGRLDGYWERGLSPWDLAAGVVLVEEAGGRVTAYDQGPFDLDSGRILATNGPLHGAIADVLATVEPLQRF